MAIFKTKNIVTVLSVGEKLTGQRTAQDISLSKAAAITKISANYLQALEQDNYKQLPGEIYAKNFLKVYARFLGLDAENILTQYLSEKKIHHKTSKFSDKVDYSKPIERIFWLNLLVTPKIIRQALVGVLILICLVYLGVKIRAIVSPPFINVTSPADNLVVGEKAITVTGQVEKEATLQINGQMVLTDEQGNFSEPLLLQAGTNIIEIVAVKKHSREAKIYRKVIVTKEN